MVNYKRISKLLSLILRHRPEEFSLQLDSYGFGSLDEVVAAIQSRYEEAGEADIRSLVGDARQQRFEIVDDKIRALYAHSFFVEMDGEPMAPPERLFMGSTRQLTQGYMKEGVKPVDRYYVHLSLTREAAAERSREDEIPLVLEILAQKAQEQGIEFYTRGQVVLALEIPADCVVEAVGVEAVEAVQPTAPAAVAPAAKTSSEPEAVSYGRKPRKDTRRR